MIEYFTIVMLIALACVGVYSFLGQMVRGQTGQMAVQVSGGAASSTNGDGTAPNGGTKHCCGVRANPPAPMEVPLPSGNSG